MNIVNEEITISTIEVCTILYDLVCKMHKKDGLNFENNNKRMISVTYQIHN